MLSILQAEPGWFGEGDDMFYVDGEKTPSIQGTGSEDYFNDAWGLHVAEGEYTGSPISEGEGLGARMTAYRWHLVDPIPFRTSLRVEIEHKGWTYLPNGRVKTAFGEREDLISSVAYWYQKEIATGQPPVPYGTARLPHGNAKQIEVENAIGDSKAENGKVSVSKDLFWGKDVLLFVADGPGSRVEVPFTVDESGRYELSTQVAQAPDYGVYEIWLDGKPVAARELEHEPGADIREQTRFDGYAYDTYVGLDRRLGWMDLAAGRHTLTFVCLGKNPASSGFTLGVDNVILARVGAEGWALAGAAKEPRLAATDAAGELRALGDADPRVRTLAALALSGAPASAEVLRGLEGALADPDPNVREAAARALGAHGPAGGPRRSRPGGGLACRGPVGSRRPRVPLRARLDRKGLGARDRRDPLDPERSLRRLGHRARDPGHPAGAAMTPRPAAAAVIALLLGIGAARAEPEPDRGSASELALSPCEDTPTAVVDQESPSPPAEAAPEDGAPGVGTMALKDTVSILGAPLHWTAKNWLVFGGVAAGVVAVGFAFDYPMRNKTQAHQTQTLDDLTKVVEPFGAGYSWAVIGAYGIAGFVFHAPDAKEHLLRQRDGERSSPPGIITPTLKFVIGRDRPSESTSSTVFHPFQGSDNAFPSGHATQAFAVASVISAHSDQVWVSVTAYTIAGLVGFARIYHNAHWTSDVTAGALIGTFVGRGIVAINDRLRGGAGQGPVRLRAALRRPDEGAAGSSSSSSGPARPSAPPGRAGRPATGRCRG